VVGFSLGKSGLIFVFGVLSVLCQLLFFGLMLSVWAIAAPVE
jgi:hypothetical protein